MVGGCVVEPTNKGGEEMLAEESGIVVRAVRAGEEKRFDELLGQYHYLGQGRPVGDYLRQVAEAQGQWVGLLAWGSACYALKLRDEWIGWSATQRAERQKLVVQNRRFLLLGKGGHQPNLASRILGAATRALPEQWRERFGYEPLLAETFTQIESFRGTSYKACGWEGMGVTKGFSRHRADLYVPHGKARKLWVKALHPQARMLLGAQSLQAPYRKGSRSSAHGVMPLKAGQIESLFDALRRVKDPRCRNRLFGIATVLVIVAMAVLSGYRDIASIWRFGTRLTQAQRAIIGLPFRKKTRFRRVPGYLVYYRLLARLDLDQFAQVLNQWLQQHQGSLPASLAMDGKMIRDTVGLLTLAEHETGAPFAMAVISSKEGQGEHCELKTGQRVVAGQDLSNRIVSSDALHTQNLTCQEILASGGDYLVQVKANRQSVLRHAQSKTAALSPLLTSARKAMAATSSANSASTP